MLPKLGGGLQLPLRDGSRYSPFGCCISAYRPASENWLIRRLLCNSNTGNAKQTGAKKPLGFRVRVSARNLVVRQIIPAQSCLSIGSLQWQQAAKLDASRLAFYYSRKFAASGLFPVERKRIEYKGLYRFFERCKGSNDGNSCLASYRHFDNGGAAGFGLAAA